MAIPLGYALWPSDFGFDTIEINVVFAVQLPIESYS